MGCCKGWACAGIAVALATFGTGMLVHASVISVPDDEPTIQRAINAAYSGDTIMVAPGQYDENIDYNGKSLYISSTEGFAATTLRAVFAQKEAVSLTHEEDSSSALIGFTILSQDFQPAIRCRNSQPAILYNRFSHGLSRDDAATCIQIEGGLCSPRIVANMFDQNSGHAIVGKDAGRVVIDSNAFVNNVADHGSAILFDGATDVIARGNLLYGNVAIKTATVLFQKVDAITFDHNTVVFNNSGTGGALVFEECHGVRVTNCLIGEDRGPYGIDWAGRDTIVAEHDNIWACAAEPFSGCSAGNGCLFVDPQFCRPGQYDLTLAANSPCLGAGENSTDIGALGYGCEQGIPLVRKPDVDPNDQDFGRGPRVPEPDDMVEVDVPPVQVESTAPVYPKEAEFNRVSGEVWVQALVYLDGSVLDARILKDSGKDFGFEQAALDAAYKNKYKPALRDGHPVMTWVTYKVEFKSKW